MNKKTFIGVILVYSTGSILSKNYFCYEIKLSRDTYSNDMPKQIFSISFVNTDRDLYTQGAKTFSIFIQNICCIDNEFALHITWHPLTCFHQSIYRYSDEIKKISFCLFCLIKQFFFHHIETSQPSNLHITPTNCLQLQKKCNAMMNDEKTISLNSNSHTKILDKNLLLSCDW